MNVLVTGGTGFIGSHLVSALLKRGYKVYALSRTPPDSNNDTIRDVEFVKADINNVQAVSEALKEVRGIFHLAGIINSNGISNKLFWKINYEGTRNLLEFACLNQVKFFVYCSSVAVFGNLAEVPASELTPCNPDNIYGETKLEAESLVRQYQKEKGLPVVIVRPSWVYGPGDRRTMKLFKAISKKRFFIIGNGKTLLHPVYVDDLAEGIILSAVNNNAIGKTYILGGDETVPLDTLVQIIADILKVKIPEYHLPFSIIWLSAVICEILFKILHKEPPIFRRRLDFFIKDQSFSIEKAKKELNFSPSTPIRQGLEKTIGWYKDRGII